MSERNERNGRGGPAFVAGCPSCDTRVATDEPNEVVAFQRRHRAITGHDAEMERAELSVDGVPEEGGVEAVVRAIQPSFDRGVPLGVVAAAMSRRGATVGETLEAVHEARMRGALYEPRDDHLGAV
ncbi:hypothetical protein [Halorarum salinum]|uniref:Uncharacterized protein n=1 Tax=Halorarum salinum TaxID=2743089 RepID=A0A7D5L916_9EURY|nr:hypothetical protein [Halobaculum salinum]QLG60509.1 hypothetical protein HUG12_01585 [Halobaculum salinum]